MAIDGLKEVQESVMRIEAGLSTYEKELAQNAATIIRTFLPSRSGKRWSAAKPDLNRPPGRQRMRIAADSGESTEEEKSDSRACVIFPHIASMAFNEPLLLNPPMRGFSFARLQAELGAAA